MNKYLFFLLGILILTGICAYSLEKNNYENGNILNKNKIIVAMGGDDGEKDQPAINPGDEKPEPQPTPRQEDEQTRRRRAEENRQMLERMKSSETPYDFARRRRDIQSRPPIPTPPGKTRIEAQPIPYQSESWDYMKQKIPQKLISKGIIKSINNDYSFELDDNKMLKFENVVFNKEKESEMLEFVRSNFVGKKVTIFHSVDRTGSYSYEMKRDKQGYYLIKNIKIQNEDLISELVKNQFASIVTQ